MARGGSNQRNRYDRDGGGVNVENGDWSRFQSLPDLMQVDFHWSGFETTKGLYGNMAEVYDTAVGALKEAYRTGRQYVLFTHGYSTSGRGKTSARSIIRALMESKEATPYIIRKKCIKHYSVFVAAIRPNPDGAAVYRRELIAEAETLQAELIELIELSGNEKYRESAKEHLKQVLYLCEEERIKKLRDKMRNYRDQYERRCGPWEMLS